MVCSLSNACAEVPPFVAHGHMKLRVGMLSLYYLCIVLVKNVWYINEDSCISLVLCPFK